MDISEGGAPDVTRLCNTPADDNPECLSLDTFNDSYKYMLRALIASGPRLTSHRLAPAFVPRYFSTSPKMSSPYTVVATDSMSLSLTCSDQN